MPAQPSPLIDREHELAEARRLFEQDEARMLTLVGPGGAGKTRLAVAIAEALAPRMLGGTYFVDLSHVADPRRVVTRIAQVLGVRDMPGEATLDALGMALAGEQVLLVLDNFEQVVAAGPDVARLLAECPGLAVLVTSRQPLRLRWEHVLPVPPLAVPELTPDVTPEQLLGYPAVALFFERARAVQPALAVTAETGRAAAEICRRLDGLPLAIEIAAARANVLAPAAILRRMGVALDLVSAGPADLPERQQSLRSAVGWSYDLLDAEKRRLFRCLSIFPGGCTGATAAEVLGEGAGEAEVLTRLTSLADHSLLSVEIERDGEPRFRMLETIRAFAAEQLAALDELPAVAGWRAAYLVRLVEEARVALLGPTQMVWLERLDREDANLQVAIRWAQECGDTATGLRLAGGLARFWELRGRLREGREIVMALLAGAGSGVDEHRLRALQAAAHLAFLEADYEAARGLHEQALADARTLEDAQAQAVALNGLGLVASCQSQLVEASERFGAALSLNWARRDRAAMATNLNNLGRVAHYLGENAQAERFQEDSLAVRRELGDSWGQAIALSDLADAVLGRGDAAKARAHQLESLALWRSLGSTWGVAYVLEGLVGVEMAQGRVEEAVCLAGGARALREQIGEPASPVRQAEGEARLTTARRLLGDLLFAAAWAEGQVMDADEAVIRAMASVQAKPAPPVRSAETPAEVDPLSPREREVARLIARGLTNRLVAETLVISERTVDVHVARILDKLGFETRSQVAAWIARRETSPA